MSVSVCVWGGGGGGVAARQFHALYMYTVGHNISCE